MGTPVKAGFGSMVVAFFCPPLYFLIRRRILAGLIHSVIYLFAIALLIFGIGIFFWAIGLIHAVWDFGSLKREETIQRQAEVIADKMAARVTIDRAR